jgi:hypothetical protein
LRIEFEKKLLCGQQEFYPCIHANCGGQFSSIALWGAWKLTWGNQEAGIAAEIRPQGFASWDCEMAFIRKRG